VAPRIPLASWIALVPVLLVAAWFARPVLSRDTNSRPVRTGRATTSSAAWMRKSPPAREAVGEARSNRSEQARSRKPKRRANRHEPGLATMGVNKAQRRSEPRLHWKADPKSDSYSVNLAKVLSSREEIFLTLVTTKSHLVVPATWYNAGHRRRLTKGRYRWYAWPDYATGGRDQRGKLLARGTFVIR
jgi:hypothetical protein